MLVIILDAMVLGDLGPDIDHLVVPLAVGDQTLDILLLDLANQILGLVEQGVFVVGNDHVVDTDGDTGLGRLPVRQGAQRVGQKHGGFLAAVAIHGVNEFGQLLLAHDPLTEAKGISGGQISYSKVRPTVVSSSSPSRRTLMAACRSTEPWSYAMRTSLTELNTPRTPCRSTLVSLYSPWRTASRGSCDTGRGQCPGRHDDRLAVRGRQNIVGAHHEHPGFHLGFDGQGHVHGHLSPSKSALNAAHTSGCS